MLYLKGIETEKIPTERNISKVVNLVEKPNVIIGKFDVAYLKIPQEILIITMQQHQKY